ncbi:SCO1664 family protein [Luteococcus sp.]|uniref:SCO1664 family protein n=1 Tax=Luteococcus sp. TaxID=1969402 RepID=UPI00373546C7
MELVGRLVQASNATFLAELDGQRVVYKPTAGEAPLRDFPDHTLGRREVAAHALSSALGLDVVPRTWWVEDAPLGPGSVQEWVEAPEQEVVEFCLLGEVEEDWFALVVGLDDQDRELALAHADHPGLRRLALFDLVANNADRKIGHLLVPGGADGRVLGVDHGLTFHPLDKLRTVLWGWSGDGFTAEEFAVLSDVAVAAEQALADWLRPVEVEAVVQRSEALLERGSWPELPNDRYPIPWPVH